MITRDNIVINTMITRLREYWTENVVPLRAYYYSKDEKLMVYEYYDQGSVSAMLHGITDLDSIS